MKRNNLGDNKVQRFGIDNKYLYKDEDLDKTQGELLDLMGHKTEDMVGKGVWYFEEQDDESSAQ